MIISQKYKYLFIEAYHTGSTAIANELIKNYDGESILYKHAHYYEFRKKIKANEKNYFVFSAVRNPLDQIVSSFVKYQNNHKNNYTDPKKFVENGGWITRAHRRRYAFTQNENNTFKDFIYEFFKKPYKHHININKPFCDFIIRFENLSEDFSKVLDLLNIEKVRNLPVVNRTKGKKNFLEYYDNETLKYMYKICGSFLREFNYEIPGIQKR